MKYDVIIGIETHIQLNTRTKMFCRCSAEFFGEEPNTHTCPTCLGLPGALPYPNKDALDKAMLMGLALHSTISAHTHFDRKNYFYPDLPKGYQISQYDEPLHVGGYVEVDGERIGLIRAHLEEDVGKLTHDGVESLVDFNKSGVPLMEIVSEPMIHSSAQAKAYVQTLRQLARYVGVNEGNLEKGTMRADINISLQEPGKWQYVDGEFKTESGYEMNKRVEVKNLNSFRAIERAIEYEMKRQSELLDRGETIVQETRGWDENKGATIGQRGKEEAHDYRYFPEPDIPPLEVGREWINQVRQQLPELPLEKKQRFMDQYGLSEYDARLLTEERLTADWFEEAVAAYQAVIGALRHPERSEGSLSNATLRRGSSASPHKDMGSQNNTVAKTMANWVLGELSRLQNEHQMLLADSKLLPAQLAATMYLIDQGTITSANAKQVLAETFVSGKDPQEIIAERGLEQVSGTDDLEPIAKKVLTDNPDAVEKIKAGKTSTIQFLVGQVMRETKGRGNPAVVRELIERLIN